MIILGSSSPRRIKLLKEITNEFKVLSPDFDEKTVDINTKHFAIVESYNKAMSLIKQINKDDCLITMDTIVMFSNKIIQKPIDINDAVNTLKMLSNKKHQVITGYTIIYKDIVINKEVISDVYFNTLSEEQINKYVQEINVLDKAGSYSYQDDEKYNLIKKIKGSRNNIIGFPSEQIIKELIKLNVI